MSVAKNASNGSEKLKLFLLSMIIVLACMVVYMHRSYGVTNMRASEMHLKQWKLLLNSTEKLVLSVRTISEDTNITKETFQQIARAVDKFSNDTKVMEGYGWGPDDGSMWNQPFNQIWILFNNYFSRKHVSLT